MILKRIVFIVFIALFFLVSCAKSNDATIDNGAFEKKIKVVFFDFYSGERVKLIVNGKMVLDENLTSNSPSNGISYIKYISVLKENVFELKCNGLKITKRIRIEPSVELIYISPNEPFITTSHSDVILLD